MDIQAIKKMIIADVADALADGFGGVDVDVQIPAALAGQVKQWCVDFVACRYIDWNNEDPYGLGVGVNRQGAKVSGISFGFDFGK